MDPHKVCKNCACYDVKTQECHRYAPKPIDLAIQKKIRWPNTPPIGWCCEFTAKE